MILQLAISQFLNNVYDRISRFIRQNRSFGLQQAPPIFWLSGMYRNETKRHVRNTKQIT